MHHLLMLCSSDTACLLDPATTFSGILGCKHQEWLASIKHQERFLQNLSVQYLNSLALLPKLVILQPAVHICHFLVLPAACYACRLLLNCFQSNGLMHLSPVVHLAFVCPSLQLAHCPMIIAYPSALIDLSKGNG